MGQVEVNSKSIVLDVDGVLLNFTEGFARFASQVLNRSIVSVSNSYELNDKFNLTAAEGEKVWEYLNSEGLGDLIPLEGAPQAFQQLKSWGYKIHLVTGIREAASVLRLGNLKKYGMTPDSIHCVEHGRAKKDSIIRQINPVAFVDDRLEHLKDASVVPNLIWVDAGDDQHGHTSDHVHMRVDLLKNWVDHWGAQFAPVQKRCSLK